jgi:TPR repeat protein
MLDTGDSLVASGEGVLIEAAPSPVFDPVGMYDPSADDVSFDAPTEAELEQYYELGDAPEARADAEAAPCDASAVDAEMHPQPVKADERPVAGSRLSPLVASDYLARARRAAQQQSMIERQRTILGIPLARLAAMKWRLSGGIAASLLLAGGWSIFSADGLAGADLVSPARAAAAQPNARDLIGDYQLGLRRIEEGRADAGIALLQHAAEGGLAVAQYRLAKAYERGEGVPRDLQAAREWTERAAAGGNCRAMHDAGVFRARGEGAQLDEAAAHRWFLQAAERGVSDSQYNLGILYLNGRGVAQSRPDALFWFLVAARSHDLDAIERAVEVAATLSPAEVERAQVRARSFHAHPGDPLANGAFGADDALSCAA